MKEWEKHVRKEGNTAYCGADIFFEWAFVDAEHGLMTEEQEGRLRICPECKKKFTPQNK